MSAPDPQAVKAAMERAWSYEGVTDTKRVARWVDGDRWWIRRPDRTWGGHMLPIREESALERETVRPPAAS